MTKFNPGPNLEILRYVLYGVNDPDQTGLPDPQIDTQRYRVREGVLDEERRLLHVDQPLLKVGLASLRQLERHHLRFLKDHLLLITVLVEGLQKVEHCIALQLRDVPEDDAADPEDEDLLGRFLVTRRQSIGDVDTVY